MDNNEKVETIRKGISRAIEYEHFDRPLSGFVALELFVLSLMLGFASVVLIEEFLLGVVSKPGFSELIWTLILGFGFMFLFGVLMENTIIKILVLLGLTVFWTFLITLAAHNFGVGIGGLIGAGLVGFAVSAFFHFVGFEALSE